MSGGETPWTPVDEGFDGWAVKSGDFYMASITPNVPEVLGWPEEKRAVLIAAAPELAEVAALIAGVEFLGREELFQDDDLVMVSVGTVRKARALLTRIRGEGHD